MEFVNSVNAAMRKLRMALGDAAEEPRYIETVKGRGYRFILPVEISESSSVGFGSARDWTGYLAAFMPPCPFVVSWVTRSLITGSSRGSERAAWAWSIGQKTLVWAGKSRSSFFRRGCHSIPSH